MKKRLPQWKTVMLLAAVAGITGCQSDDDSFEKPPVTIGETQMYADTLTVGQQVTLRPTSGTGEETIYKWIINGREVGRDSVFTFEPTERGSYELSFSAISQRREASAVYNIHAWGAYENGFYIVNEGWFGHGTGTVSFYRYDTEALEDSVFVKANPGKDLLPVSSTLQYGTIFNEQLYLVSKAGGPVVVANAYSLEEVERIPAQGGHNWRAFTGLDISRGLLSSGDGVHKLNLNPIGLDGRVEGINGQTGDMIKAGEYVFVLSASEGVVVLNTANLEIEKNIPGMQVGFARTADGKVWAAGGNKLISIDPVTLNTEEVELGFEAYGSWGAWHPGSITAGASEVYIARNGAWSGGSEIYRYTGDTASLAVPFISLPEGKVMYGAGLGYDPNTNRIVVNTVNRGWGDSFKANVLYFYNAQSGEKVGENDYEGFYFPSVSVFH